jgi:DNA repair protein SbcC/Rad50
MRPITLDMNGFASFREATTIDFSDADFFALVGPTGSGKSTVIDAMTFALYGSVPRWGRKGMVSLALAPTTGRATVRLVFEVEDQRYVVARELRRVGSGPGTQVSQRAATLERVTGRDGPTEVLAGDLAGVGEAVERLLGLSYEDFCQCVVLPQGQFADFLHATPKDRQEILLRLLGAEHYRQMMVRANQRASDAGQRAGTLDETLATFADATQQAQDAAEAAQTILQRLAERAEADRPRIQAADRELSSAETELERLERERTALAAVGIPDDVAELDAGLSAARAAAQQAHAAEQGALAADQAARAELAAGPRRAPLELARQRRAERGERADGLPKAKRELERLSGLSGRAETAVTDAAAALEALRGQRDEAAASAAAAGQRVRDLDAEHAALSRVAVPAGVDELDARRDAAIAAGEQALTALQAAEQADADARAARDAGTGSGALEQAQRELSDLQKLATDRDKARTGLRRARAAHASADSALATAEAGYEQRQREVDEARRAHVVADLRPHLVAGQPCPVCEQTVTALPAPLPEAAIEDAQARLEEAGRAVTAARAAAGRAAVADERAAAGLESLTDQRLRRLAALAAAQAGPLSGASLPALAGVLNEASAKAGRHAGPADAGNPDDADAKEEVRHVDAALAEVAGALSARHERDAAAAAAARAVQAARARAGAARKELDLTQADADGARARLRDARDPLVRLGAPPADDPSIAAAWHQLASWAAAQARAREAELAEAREAAGAAAGQHEKAQDQFAHAEADLNELRAEATKAGRAEQEARTRLAELTDRIAELDELLRDAPDEEQVTAQLARLRQLEAAAAGAERTLLDARAVRGDAERGRAELERSESAARARLSAARDPLVAMGAPALDAAGLLAGWTELHGWACGEVAARDQRIASARERVAAARASLQELTGRLSADLAAGGVELAPEAVAAGAPAAVASALERARAECRRIAERRAQAADLTARRDAAEDERRVARMLGDLLRANRFPQWLVTAAVDALVAEASTNLAGLTNAQFDLTHEAGEFYVIDHADADSRRSVRTLSGGETFQASLALALALSAQMSTLAAAGAARLDSIFLDEGFGTLDPETLEVVATTLETLAQGQRMVGVITHVAALAERVPVRFLVSRDARTSRVVREGAAAGELADAG